MENDVFPGFWRYTAWREKVKIVAKTESRAQWWLHRRWDREEDIPLIRLPEQRLKEMKNKEEKGLSAMALHTCSHLSATTNYKLLPDASLKIQWSTFIKNRASPCSTYQPYPHTHPAPSQSLEKRSPSTLDLLFKIQTLVGGKENKKSKTEDKEQLIYDQILRKKSLIL